MTLADCINAMVERTRCEKLVADASLSELETLWNEWDGVALIHLGGEYIHESYVVQELYKRGSKVEYLP